MNVDDATKWGVGSLISSLLAWFSFAKLRDDRRTSRADRAEKARLLAIDVANQSLSGWKEMVTVLRGERDELSKRVDHLQASMDSMRDEMRSGFDRRDATIDLLRGENRELKQLAGSHARNRTLRPNEPPETGT